jgi:hypothetical protein
MFVRNSIGAALLVAGLGSLAAAGSFDDQADASAAVTRQFPAPVEAWRPPIEQEAAGAGVPVDFLLTWVQHESFGNPCSLGIPGHEAGIAQTYHPDDDRFGATFDELRAACVPSTQNLARPLTPDEKRLQVSSLVGLVKGARDAARQQMSRAGVTWSESSPDFWNLVKLRHALPAWGADYLRPCGDELGHPPSTWGEFRGWIEGLSDERVTAINPKVAPWASLAERRRLFDNAEKTGKAVADASTAAGGQ